MDCQRLKRVHARILELYVQIDASHTPAQRQGKRRDLVDDLMKLHQSDPQFLPDTDLGFAFIAPIIAGHYKGSAIAFAIYEMLVNPHLQDRIAAEADARVHHGDVTAASGNADAPAHRYERVRDRGHGDTGQQHDSDRLSGNSFRRGTLQGSRYLRYRTARAASERT